MQPAHILTTLFGRSFVCKNQDVGPGGGFYLHPVTPLSFKSDDSKFVQSYFSVGSIFYDVISALMSIEKCYKQPILKSLMLLYVSLNRIETWQKYLTLILLHSQKVRLMFLGFDDVINIVFAFLTKKGRFFCFLSNI